MKNQKRFPHIILANLWFRRALHLHAAGDLSDRVIEAYSKSIELRPDDCAGWSNMGAIYFDRGDWSNCERCYLSALAVRPDSQNVHQNLGLLYKTIGDLEKSKAHYDKAKEPEGRRPPFVASKDEWEESVAVFIEHVKSTYLSDCGDDPRKSAIYEEWPDLIVAYEKAIESLEQLRKPE